MTGYEEGKTVNNAVLRVIDNTLKISRGKIKPSEKDYRNSQGILICGNCHTPKEKKINIAKSNPLYEKYKNHLFPIVCGCKKQKQKEEEKSRKKADTLRLIEKFRKEGITDKNYLKYTFESDDRKNPEISEACKKYADNFDDMLKLSKGLMFCGQIGTGKTFYAGCIANFVISIAKSVLMTNIPNLIAKLGFDHAEKNDILSKIANVSLLVIDDLGVERSTSYSLEKIYEIIDTRYRSGKPLIVTTNLKYSDMKNCESVEYRRIYDRILHMCHPIAVLGESRRIEESRKSLDFMNEFLGLGQSE